MSFMNLIRGFLGFPPDNSLNNGRPSQHENLPDELRKNFRVEDEDEDDVAEDGYDHYRWFDDPGDQVEEDLTDPFGIHNFLQEQMDDMMQNFQSFGLRLFGPRGTLPIEPSPFEEFRSHSFTEDKQTPRKNLRDEFLKPGYEMDDKEVPTQKMDSDLDDRMVAEDLGKILQQRTEPEERVRHRSIVPSARFFGKFVQTKVIRSPNGGVEEHRTVRDNKGNEETRVTRTLGDQTYTVTTRTSANGEQEKIEDFTNIKEGDLEDFEKKWGSKL